MNVDVRQVSYYTTTIQDEPGEGYRLLSLLAEGGVNLVAFHAMPVGPTRTQLTLFPEDEGAFRKVARDANLTVDGPHRALLVQGDDEMGALARIHKRLSDADVEVFACTGIADGRGRYGCLLYLRAEEYQKAAATLGID